MQVVCGPINGTLLYYTDEFVGGGANIMIEIQRQSIKDLSDLLSERGLKLPGYLMLQFDNCGENKVQTCDIKVCNWQMNFINGLISLPFFSLSLTNLLPRLHTRPRLHNHSLVSFAVRSLTPCIE